MRVLSKSSELQLLRQIEEDSGYDFSQNAKVRICTLNITQANKSKEIKQIAVEEMDASGNGSVLFIIPFQRNEENELQRISAIEPRRGGSDSYNLVKGSVNLYVRAYYTRSTAGNLYYLFRPTGADMRCTYSSGAVTEGAVGLGLFGELYNTAVNPPTVVNEYYTYTDRKTIGNMTSGTTYYRAVTPLIANRYIYMLAAEDCRVASSCCFGRSSTMDRRIRVLVTRRFGYHNVLSWIGRQGKERRGLS